MSKIIIGITGGIGSGKSTVAGFFQENGIPIYNSDIRAKQLMIDATTIKNYLISTYGEDIYKGNELNRKKLANIVFSNPEALAALNAVVHPAVFTDFEEWKNQQTEPILGKEAAILFESGSYKDCDYIVSVIANENLRIARVMQRDGSTKTEVQKRIHQQWTDEQRRAKSDFIIKNEKDLITLKKNSLLLIEQIKNKIANET